MSSAEVLSEVQAEIEHLLGQHFDDTITLTNVRQSSAGARRLNLLFTTLGSEGAETPLVATIVSDAHILVSEVASEVAVIQAALAAGVQAPAIVLQGNLSVGPFFITKQLAGETVPRKILRLVEYRRTGASIVHSLGVNAARIHQISPEKYPQHLAQVSTGVAEVALTTLNEQLELLLQPAPVFQLALRWLQLNQPSKMQTCLIHGDLRNGNLVIDKTGLVGILDWELARLGDPMEDLAWLCMRTWRFGNDTRVVGGFGDLADLVSAYENSGGQFDAQRFHWWQVLGNLRWGLGLAGQARAHIEGVVKSIVMAASGKRVAELEWDLLGLLEQN